jgi:hypothetical protein
MDEKEYEEYQRRQGEEAQWAYECDEFNETFKGPDYDYWAKMEHWTFNEALFLSLDIKPFEDPGVPSVDTYGYTEMHYFGYVENDLSHISNFYVKELKRRKQYIQRALKRIGVSLDGKEKNARIYPAKFVKWCRDKNLNIPVELVEAVKLYNEKDFAPETNDEPITAKEKRELGTLRQEKKKWETAIEATVEAMEFAQGSRITHDQLIDRLHPFKLPESTIKLIWKALRGKGLTKGPGRPPKEKEKNP